MARKKVDEDPDAPKGRPVKCIVSSCQGKAQYRGLCSQCYGGAKQLIESKETTWIELVKRGLAGGPAIVEEFFKKQKEFNFPDEPGPSKPVADTFQIVNSLGKVVARSGDGTDPGPSEPLRPGDKNYVDCKSSPDLVHAETADVDLITIAEKLLSQLKGYYFFPKIIINDADINDLKNKLDIQTKAVIDETIHLLGKIK